MAAAGSNRWLRAGDDFQSCPHQPARWPALRAALPGTVAHAGRIWFRLRAVPIGVALLLFLCAAAGGSPRLRLDARGLARSHVLASRLTGIDLVFAAARFACRRAGQRAARA